MNSKPWEQFKKPAPWEQYKAEASRPSFPQEVTEAVVPAPPTFKERLPVIGTYEKPELGIASPSDLKETLNGKDMDFANLSNTPDEHLASLGNSKFFAEHYWLDREQATSQELMIGRALYANDTLSSYQINSLINEDLQNGTFEKRASRAKWTQHGVSPETADDLNKLYHSSLVDDISYYASTLPAGIVKAIAGTVVGAGDTLGIETPMTEKYLEGLRGAQQGWLDDALIQGDMGHYMTGSILQAGGDIGGNFWMMGRYIKTANALSGGSMTLGTRAKTLKTVASNTAAKAFFLGAMSYIRTEGGVEEKMRSALLTIAYMSTPIISSMAPNDFSAFLVDFGLNSGITAFYNPETGEFGIGGQYKQAKENAKNLVNEMHPDMKDVEKEAMTDKVFLAMSIPIIGSDIAFSAMTKSIKQTKNSPMLSKYIESARLLKQGGAIEAQAFDKAMESKYGKGWEQSMSEADRTMHNSLKIVNDAIESGGISEKALETPAMDTVSRVKIENGKVTYRDSDGITRDINGKSIGDTGRTTVEPAKEVADQTPKEASINIDEALKGFEDVGVYDKPADAPATKAEAKVEKGSVDVTPPDPAIKDTAGWMSSQITYISTLMRAGEIKTKADYKAILDTYPQRDGVDADQVYKEAKLATKAVKTAIAGAEKKSAKGKVTQAQFKRKKDMVLVNSMTIIKDRIRAIKEGVFEGKKIGKEQEKAKSKAREDIVAEALKIVTEMTKGKDIENAKSAKDKFKVKANSLKTPKALDKFIDNLTKFVSEEVDAKERSGYINTISKDVKGEYSYEQNLALQGIKDSLLISASDKAVKELDATREWLSRNPDAQLPTGIVSALKKTPIQNMSTEQLKIIAGEVSRLRKEKATKAKLQRKAVDAEYREDSDAIQSTMKKSRRKKEGKEDIAGKKTRVASAKYSATRPDRAMDDLDGARGTFDGKAHKVFIDDKRSAEAKRDEMSDSRLHAGERLMKDLGVPIKMLNRKVTLFDDAEPLTLQQLMGIYAGSKNRLNRSAILHAHFNGDEARMQKAVNYIENNPQLKTISDYILYDGASNAPRFFDAVGRLTGEVLTPEEFYVPMNRIDVDRPTDMDNMQQQLMNRVNIIKEAPDDSMTISREYIKDGSQTKIDLDLVSNWERNVRAQEHLINLAPVVKRMRGVAESEGFMDGVRDGYGEGMVEQVNGLIDRTANPMSIRATGNLNKISRRMRKNVASAYLAGNIKTMIKQFPSFLLYSGEVGLPKLVDSLNLVNSSWEMVEGRPRNKIIDFVSEKDPTVKHSHLQRELDELRGSDIGKYNQIMDKVGEVGFAGIVEMDKLARSAGWYAVYMKGIESGKGEAESIRLARNATMRTQPSAGASELPPMYATNEGMNWLLMFSNQLNQIHNMQTKDVPRRIKTGIKEKDWSLAGAGLAEQGGLVATALLIGAINNGGFDGSEDLVKSVMKQGMASTPFVGSSLSGAVDGFKPSLQIVDTAYDAGKIIVTLANGEKVEQEEYADMLIDNIMPFGGVPVIAGKRAAQAVKEGSLTPLTGIKKKKRSGRL